MTDPPVPPEQQDKLLAAIEMLRRTGMESFQLRWSDDNEPVVWMAVALYDEASDAAASLDPLRATLRLCEQLIDGGTCKHCGRGTGFEPDSIETMPANQMICWYQYDPELKTFRRGCEGET